MRFELQPKDEFDDEPVYAEIEEGRLLINWEFKPGHDYTSLDLGENSMRTLYQMLKNHFSQ